MQKVILLSVSSFAMLMADFTLIGKQLTPVVTEMIIVGTNMSNEYLEQITIPACDTNNPEVQFIRTAANWSAINSAKRIFCVSPGDYSSLGSINLTASGTSDEPRYIILNNGNNTHPVNLSRTELAKYRLKFTNADYWVIDRQAYWETTDPFERYNELFSSSGNIFNRGLLQDTSNGFTIRNGSDGNTIQNHHIEKTQWSVDRHNFYDTAAINYFAENNGESMINNKVINNEIINYVDAVQTVRYAGAYNLVNGEAPEINFEGLVISDNEMYVTSIMYSDGAGNSTPTGEKSFTENAIDLKGGSLNAANPVIITNNRMWGYKPVDNTYSNLGDSGNALVVHYDVRNVEINNNLIFNSDYGIVGGAPLGNRYPLEDSKIENNIIYNIKGHTILFTGSSVEGVYDGLKNVVISNNLLKGSTSSAIMKIYNTDTLTLIDNVMVDSSGMWFAESSTFGDKYKSFSLSATANKFYNMNGNVPTYATQSDNIRIDQNLDHSIYNSDYKIGKFTFTPKIIQLF